MCKLCLPFWGDRGEVKHLHKPIDCDSDGISKFLSSVPCLLVQWWHYLIILIRDHPSTAPCRVWNSHSPSPQHLLLLFSLTVTAGDLVLSLIYIFLKCNYSLTRLSGFNLFILQAIQNSAPPLSKTKLFFLSWHFSAQESLMCPCCLQTKAQFLSWGLRAL